MNEFFAAAPSCCDNASELRFLLGHFGPLTGRYLANYPASWKEDILRHCEQLGPMEAERIKTLLRRAREKATLLEKRNLAWNSGIDWINNYINLVRAEPNAFENAIFPRSTPTPPFLTLDDLDLPPTADESIEGCVGEYVRVSKTLLLISPELIFVDPYLNPCKQDRREVLSEMFRIAKGGKCRKITCWATDTNVVGERSHTWDEVKSAWRDILERIDWPSDRVFRYVLANDVKATTKMHARYLLSIKGGIRFDRGFQRTKGRNDVSPVGEKVHLGLVRIFHEGNHDMECAFEFNRA